MSRLSDAIRAHTLRQIQARRQVRAGRYVRPFGLRRGLVRIGACGQIVTGDRLADLSPGDPVLVASDGPRAILAAPSRRPGPASTATKKLGGAPYLGLPDPVAGTIYGVHIDAATTPPTVVIVTYSDADGTPQAVVGTVSLHPNVSEASGSTFPRCIISATGTLILSTKRAGVAFGDHFDTLEEIDARRASLVGRYLWDYPPLVDPNTLNMKANLSPPAILSGTVYWAEMSVDDVANTYTWRLKSAVVGSLGSASEVAVIPDEPYSNIAAEPIASPHVRALASWLFNDAGVWLHDAEVDYVIDSSPYATAAGTDRSVNFSTLVDAVKVTGGPSSIQGAVDGNTVGFNTTLISTSPRTVGVLHSGPPTNSRAHGTVGGVRQFGITKTGGSAFTFQELTLADGTYNSVACADADAFTGRTLAPLCCARL